MEALKPLLYIIFFFLLLRVLWKFFGKMFLKWIGLQAMKKVNKHVEKSGAFGNFNTASNAPPSSKNSTRVDSNNTKPKSDKVVGEYVDYEEID